MFDESDVDRLVESCHVNVESTSRSILNIVIASANDKIMTS